MSQKNRNIIPMNVPAIGGHQVQQVSFDVNEAVKQVCNNCSGGKFEKLYRIGFISELASNNRTGQKITVEYPAYICYDCGCEIGKTLVKQ